MNGDRLPLDDAANVATWQVLAAGTMTEADLAKWLREIMVSIG